MKGPFGDCPRMSVGDVLNALCRIEQVPLSTVERFVVSGDTISIGEQKPAAGHYKYFDGIEQPLFMWTGERHYAKHHFQMNDNGEIIPMFRLSLGPHGNPAFIINGPDATSELHQALHRMLTNIITAEEYQIHKNAGAFFQGGSDNPGGQHFYMEFWRPEGAQAFIDHLNKMYRPQKE